MSRQSQTLPRARRPSATWATRPAHRAKVEAQTPPRPTLTRSLPYSDITIAEADSQKVPPEGADKPVTPPQPATSDGNSSKGEDVSVDRDPAPRIPKVDKP